MLVEESNNMNITFGIITSGQNDNILSTVIDSIVSQRIPHYEIIIVGNTTVAHESIKRMDFDESIRPNWITRKKNIICHAASYDVIVLLHDYVRLCDGWYAGFLRFGTEFDVCVTAIQSVDGRRFRDSTLFHYDLGHPYEKRTLLPYHYPLTSKMNRLLYISGTYYVVKKQLALDHPLDERLCWGHGEDAEWSKRLTDHDIRLQCNPYSTVQLQKYKEQGVWEQEMTVEDCEHIDALSEDEIERMNRISKLNIKNYIRNQAGIDL